MKRRPPIFRLVVGRIGHPQWAEDVIAEIGLEVLARKRFDDAASPIDAGAVEPLLTRIEEQRACGIRFARTRLEIAHDRTREVVAESGCVREHMPDSRRSFGGPECVLTSLRIEGLEDFQVRELRKVLLGRIVEAEPALFNQLHHGQRGDRLGHRRDAEDGIDGHRAAARGVRHSEGSLVHDAAAIRDHRDHAWNITTCDGIGQHLINGCRCAGRAQGCRLLCGRGLQPTLCNGAGGLRGRQKSDECAGSIRILRACRNPGGEHSYSLNLWRQRSNIVDARLRQEFADLLEADLCLSTRHHGADSLEVDSPALPQHLIGDSQALKQLGGEIAPADAGGIRDRFRLQKRACQGIHRADVRLGRARSHGHTDARTRKRNPAVGQNPAVLDQLIQRVVRHDHDVDGFTALEAAGNGV